MAFSLFNTSVTRRQALRLGLGGACCLVGLSQAACTPQDVAPSQDQPTVKGIDKEAFDALIAQGPVASQADIDKSTWASQVAKAQKLRVGGVKTSILFASLDEADGKIRGFDAGLVSLLTRYVLGDESKSDLTLVTSNTRESVLQNEQVDVVFATYSITDARKKAVSFAGPYYSTQQGIMVAQSNTTINGLSDLAQKNVAAQSGSTGPTILEQLAPEAKVQEFTTDEEARNALSQGRVDAYVIDETMQRGSIVRNPGKYKLVGESFGPVDYYGIGLPLNSDGVDFVNTFLKKVEDAGLWAELWKVAIGNRTEATKVPAPPSIGV